MTSPNRGRKPGGFFLGASSVTSTLSYNPRAYEPRFGAIDRIGLQFGCYAGRLKYRLNQSMVRFQASHAAVRL